LAEFLLRCSNDWLRRRVEGLFTLLREDREMGVKIPKSRWPRSYVSRWGIRNLYKCNAGPDWRMTYTLIFDGAGIVVQALEVLPHKEYDRLFGYGTS